MHEVSCRVFPSVVVQSKAIIAERVSGQGRCFAVKQLALPTWLPKRSMDVSDGSTPLPGAMRASMPLSLMWFLEDHDVGRCRTPTPRRTPPAARPPRSPRRPQRSRRPPADRSTRACAPAAPRPAADAARAAACRARARRLPGTWRGGVA